MEQTYLEIKSRGTSKRLYWSGGKLKSRKRDSKESSSQLDGRRTSWTSGDASRGWRIGIRRLLTPSRRCSNLMNNLQRQRSITHVRPIPINLTTPYVDSVVKLPKVSLTCWRVVLGLRRISTSRVLKRPSKYFSGKWLESFGSLIRYHRGILRSFSNPFTSHPRPRHIEIFQSLQ